MPDNLSISFPCYALTTHPFRFDDAGRQIMEHSKFATVEATDGTTFLLVFRTKNNMDHFVIDSKHVGLVLQLELDTPRKLSGLVQMISGSLGKPVGILVDPDANLQGFPISPEDAAK